MKVISTRAYFSELVVNWLGNNTLDSLFDELRNRPQVLCILPTTLFSLGAIITVLFAIGAVIDIIKRVFDEHKQTKQENYKLKHKNTLKNKLIAKNRKILTEKEALLATQKTSLDATNKANAGLKLENNALKRKVEDLESRTRLGFTPHLVSNNLSLANGIASLATPSEPVTSLGITSNVLSGLIYNPATKFGQ